MSFAEGAFWRQTPPSQCADRLGRQRGDYKSLIILQFTSVTWTQVKLYGCSLSIVLCLPEPSGVFRTTGHEVPTMGPTALSPSAARLPAPRLWLGPCLVGRPCSPLDPGDSEATWPWASQGHLPLMTCLSGSQTRSLISPVTKRASLRPPFPVLTAHRLAGRVCDRHPGASLRVPEASPPLHRLSLAESQAKTTKGFVL